MFKMNIIRYFVAHAGKKAIVKVEALERTTEGYELGWAMDSDICASGGCDERACVYNEGIKNG